MSTNKDDKNDDKAKQNEDSQKLSVLEGLFIGDRLGPTLNSPTLHKGISDEAMRLGVLQDELQPSLVRAGSIAMEINEVMAPHHTQLVKLGSVADQLGPTLTGLQDTVGSIKQNWDQLNSSLLFVDDFGTSSLFKGLGGVVSGDDILLEGKSLYDFEGEERKEEIQKVKEALEKSDRFKSEEINELKRRIKNLEQEKSKNNLEGLEVMRRLENRDAGLPLPKKVSRGSQVGNITFNYETGKVFVGRKLGGQIQPNSRDYHFFCILFKARGETVAYSDLVEKLSNCFGGQGSSAKTPNNYCQSVKSEIKGYAPTVAARIRSYSNLEGRGYRLICFDHQKNIRKGQRKY